MRRALAKYGWILVIIVSGLVVFVLDPGEDPPWIVQSVGNLGILALAISCIVRGLRSDSQRCTDGRDHANGTSAERR